MTEETQHLSQRSTDDAPPESPKTGPLGDVLPSERQPAKRTPGGQLPEQVEDRPMVGTVKPEDYPEQQ